MDWLLLDKNEHAEEYKPSVYLDDCSKNFSIFVGAVFENAAGTVRPKLDSTVRSPFAAIYLDNFVFVVSTTEHELKLHKTFEINIRTALIRNKEDTLIVILENDEIVSIDIRDGNERRFKKSTAHRNSVVDFMIEDGECVLLVDRFSTFERITETTTDDRLINFTAIAPDKMNQKTVTDIMLHQNGWIKTHKSALCIRVSSNSDMETFCPVTNQRHIIENRLRITDIKPFYDSSNMLVLSEDLMFEEKLSLRIVDFLSSTSQFNISVSKDCALICGINESVFYTDVINNKLYLFMVKENSPMTQLEILISLGNYEGAELFAKSHNLSPNAVLELKSKILLNNLKQSFCQDKLKELEKVLTECDNIEFIVNCCCDAAEFNVDLACLLQFCKKALLNTNNTDLNKKVDELIWRVDAFKLIDLECMKDISLSWDIFVSENAMTLCKKFIVADLLDYAIIIWIKSYRVVYNSIKIRDIADLLCSISLDTKLNSLLRWLEYFIPSIISVMPYTADIIITWAQDRICVLENSINWPEVGIQFAEKFSNLMFNSKGLIYFTPPSAEKVFYLISCMKHIQVLKKDFNVLISLRDFTTLCPNELVKMILRKVFAEDIRGLMNSFLDNFILKHNLNHDVLIKEYIEELVSSVSSIDENKVGVLIHCIHNIDEKHQCIIQVLKCIPVPWSSVVKKIASEAVVSKHPLATKIRLEIIHADLRTILIKYKCPELSYDDFEYLIRLIIKKGDTDMISDIESITNIYSDLKEDAYLLCLQYYIEQNEVHTALNLFDKIQCIFKNSCAKTLAIMLEDQLNNHIYNEQLESNYLDFLKSVNEIDEYSLNVLSNIYNLKNRYQFSISLGNYYVEEYREYYFTMWCKKEIKQVSLNNIRNFIRNCIQIGQLLMITKTNSVLIMLNQSSHEVMQNISHVIFADIFFYLEKDVKSLDIILKLFPIIDNIDFSTINVVLKHVFDLMQDCDPEFLSYVVEVASWLTSIYHAHNNTREILNTWKISAFYNPHIVNSSIPIWCEIMKQNNVINYKTNNFIICLCKSDSKCMDGSKCLKKLLNKCQLEQNDESYIKIISYCSSRFIKMNQEIPSWLKDLSDSAIKTMLSKVAMFENPDHFLTSMLVLSLSRPDEWLNDTLMNSIQTCRRINIAHHIIQFKDFYSHINAPHIQALSINSQNLLQSKLENCGIDLKNRDSDSYDFLLLFETLANKKSLSVDILEEFCSVENINLDHVLTLYLFSILKWWDEEYVFTYNSLGKCNVTLLTKKDNLKHCLEIVNKVTSKEELVGYLISLFKNGEVNIQNSITVTLDLYCYEIYIFILDLLKNISGKQMFLREYLLLKFLQTYQRVTKPKQTEFDEFSMKENFPKIGYYRLPVRSIMSDHFWNDLKPEVTLTTYKQWLSIAGLLPLNIDVQVSRDMICSNAVKQSMTVEKTQNDGSRIKWTIHSRNDRLLKEAYDCVQHITNLEWAGACVYYVFQGSALGADQVAAADMCYQFAEHWAKIEPNHDIVKKMRTKHRLTSAAHILHKIGLAEDKLLSLCENPQRLIEALYNRNSILTSYESPDINSAVDEIAEKHNLNIGSLRLQMLQRILNINDVHYLDSSVNTSKSILMADGTLNKETLMKVCYIFKGTNEMMTAFYLSRIGLNNDEVIKNYNTNIRALQCLLSLTSNDVIEKVTNLKVSDLWSKLWNLYVMNGLHLLGLEYLISEFNGNKPYVIQQIWHTRDHNSFTISLVIKIMIVYNIQIDDILLEDIIKVMVKFDMLYEISNFLLSVKLVYSPNYIDMWNHVLLTPFKRLDVPLIGQQKNECYEALKLLPICPLTSCIELSLIWEKCLRFSIIDMVIILLPHLEKSERMMVIKRIGKIKKSTMQELKLATKKKGILTTNMILSILKSELF